MDSSFFFFITMNFIHRGVCRSSVPLPGAFIPPALFLSSMSSAEWQIKDLGGFLTPFSQKAQWQTKGKWRSNNSVTQAAAGSSTHACGSESFWGHGCRAFLGFSRVGGRWRHKKLRSDLGNCFHRHLLLSPPTPLQTSTAFILPSFLISMLSLPLVNKFWCRRKSQHIREQRRKAQLAVA